MERRAMEEEINRLQVEKLRIENRIASLQSQLDQTESQKQLNDMNLYGRKSKSSSPYGVHGLSREMIHRYSRHLLLPDFGIRGIFFLFLLQTTKLLWINYLYHFI